MFGLLDEARLFFAVFVAGLGALGSTAYAFAAHEARLNVHARSDTWQDKGGYGVRCAEDKARVVMHVNFFDRTLNVSFRAHRRRHTHTHLCV